MNSNLDFKPYQNISLKTFKTLFLCNIGIAVYRALALYSI